jgi:glycosyltransferase involved in cell wall biosynthesis
VPVVILPVLNESLALPGLLDSMPAGYRPIVVDNGSTDGSAAIAVGRGAEVVHAALRGFGAACWAGLVAARPSDGVVCFMDADGSLDPADLPRVAGPVLDGRAELVLGRRRPQGRGAWPLHARVANRVLARELARRTGQRLADIGPMRAAGRDALLELGLRDRRFGWPLEMVLRAAAAGWRMVEVPVPYAPRQGRSKVTGTVGGTLRTVSDMRRVLRTATEAAAAAPDCGGIRGEAAVRRGGAGQAAPAAPDQGARARTAAVGP